MPTIPEKQIPQERIPMKKVKLAELTLNEVKSAGWDTIAAIERLKEQLLAINNELIARANNGHDKGAGDIGEAKGDAQGEGESTGTEE